MRDEPESERRMLRMNAHPHEQFGATDVGRDGRICREQPGSGMGGNGPAGGVRVYRAGAEASAVQPAAQVAAGDYTGVPAPSDRAEPGADESTDPALDAGATDRTQAGEAVELQAVYNGTLPE